MWHEQNIKLEIILTISMISKVIFSLKDIIHLVRTGLGLAVLYVAEITISRKYHC
jgi:hypothetical protein